MLRVPEMMACGRVQTDGTTVSPFFAEGCTVARAGAGLYDITVDPGVNPSANVGEVTVSALPETTAIQLRVTHTSDTVKRITAENNAGAATDAAFNFEIKRVRNYMGG